MTDYTALVFDCDGVVLDSNKVKTEAFYQATLPFGKAAAQAMVDYHIANGGISRYKKFAYFLEHIALTHATNRKSLSLEELLKAYASHVYRGLLSCDVAPGLELLRQKTPDARWLIVSGGDQVELRDVFTQRGIATWFDGGVFGSPDTKDEILARELASANIQKPALFLGDSKYDFQAATNAGLEFVFLSDWSEVAGWEHWTAMEGIHTRNSIKELIET
ncbi:HAD family hydrolase [Vreelandella aquamarina]|uniref:HAD family hydrolase n=1 Tax=Vreelandella aquamarina TaxID=77097 RepID=UPI003CFC37D3